MKTRQQSDKVHLANQIIRIFPEFDLRTFSTTMGKSTKRRERRKKEALHHMTVTKLLNQLINNAQELAVFLNGALSLHLKQRFGNFEAKERFESRMQQQKADIYCKAVSKPTFSLEASLLQNKHEDQWTARVEQVRCSSGGDNLYSQASGEDFILQKRQKIRRFKKWGRLPILSRRFQCQRQEK